jgi:hypothetical protein
VPQGVDADQLVTVLAFDLNPTARWPGGPAWSAVRHHRQQPPAGAAPCRKCDPRGQLAAPFNLPQYYDAWKHVHSASTGTCRNDFA